MPANKNNPSDKKFPSCPNDLVYAGGFNSQIVAIIPSRDVVIVRLGVTHDKILESRSIYQPGIKQHLNWGQCT